jgi:hypothetical protein
MEIFVNRNGETLGPYSPDQLREMQGKGVVFPMDLVRIDGAEDWRPLYQIPTLFQRAVHGEEPAPVRPVRDERSTVATVTDEDIALFAGRRHKHYVKVWNNGDPRFSFNAGVLLLSWVWFLYRRLYWQGAVAFVAIYGSFLFGRHLLPLATDLTVLYALPVAVVAVFLGDRLYLRQAERKIKAIKEKYREGAAQKEFIRRAGGTNLWWVAVGLVLTVAPSAYRGYKAGVESVEGPTVAPTTVSTSPKPSGTPSSAPTPAPIQEDELLVAVRNAVGLTDVKQVSEIPADYVGTHEIVAVQPENGEPTVPPPNARWQVTISAKSLRSRDSSTTFDAIFIGKKNNVPCVVALTTTKATYFFTKLDPKADALGATCYFEAVGKDDKLVKFLLRDSTPSNDQASGNSDLLGAQWIETEVDGWHGAWIRNGRSNRFDATIRKGAETKTFSADVILNGRSVLITSRNASDGRNCSYQGTISADGSSVNGTYHFNGSGTYPWEARIRQ